MTYPLTFLYVKAHEDTPFTKALRNILVRGAPVSLKSALIALYFRLLMTVRDVTFKIELLISVRMMAFHHSRG